MPPLPLPPSSLTGDLWQALLESQKPIFVYGMGNGADKLFDRLIAMGRPPVGVFASDGFVRGQSFRSHTVLPLSKVCAHYPDFIALVSFGSRLPEVIESVRALANEKELYVPDMPLAGDSYFTADFYREHREALLTVYDALADESSKNLLSSLILYKLTGRVDMLFDAVCTGDEASLLRLAQTRSAVDVGAYRGDTLLSLLHDAPLLTHVIAVEPDTRSFRKLSALSATLKGIDVTCVPAAAFSEDGKATFCASGNRNATLGTALRANTASYQSKGTCVDTVKIDTLTIGRSVDYVKYDTEGAEMAALEGSVETIERCHPALRIALYHRSEDLYEIPLWLMRRFPGKYDLYLRRTPCFPAWECDLIAIPTHGI